MIRSVTAYVYKNTIHGFRLANAKLTWYDAGARGFDLGDYADFFASIYRFLAGPCWQWVQHHAACIRDLVAALFDA